MSVSEVATVTPKFRAVIYLHICTCIYVVICKDYDLPYDSSIFISSTILDLVDRDLPFYVVIEA